jgi:hypothetical protein
MMQRQRKLLGTQDGRMVFCSTFCTQRRHLHFLDDHPLNGSMHQKRSYGGRVRMEFAISRQHKRNPQATSHN